ncbi:hypothetical protein [Caballeronia sp. LZ032]|uniref:phage nozzle protein n=1 Tax=Caballeronia sp. LZ032 TaxID=3038565 RepID=UPI002862F7CA|nr:hypothetical protein [Caballeronia sp. LZ032]MDR5879021.1 hypothetical protein [Caballeronia sp. LZ032]
MDEIINLLPSVEYGGLADRVGATSLGCWAAANFKGADNFMFRTTDGQQWAVLPGSAAGTLRVLNLAAGVEVTVTAGPYVQQYLAVGNGAGLRFLQIEDTVLIVNPSVTVRFNASTAPEPNTRAYLQIKKLSSNDQTFYIGGSMGSASILYAGSSQTRTREYVADLLMQKIGANMPGIGVSRIGNVLRIVGTADQIASLTANNDWDSTALVFTKGHVTSLDDLPPVMFSNEPLLVDLSAGKRETAYWVTYDASSNSYKETSWLDYGASSGSLDQSTMPVRLHQTGPSSFELQPVDWTERKVGDGYSNPPPPFVDNVLRDLALWKGRLWFLSTGWLCASQPDDYFNCFAGTAREVLASDPIKQQLDGDLGKGNYLETMRDALMIFTDFAQSMIDGSTPPTPQNTTIGVATRYVTDGNCGPVAIGDALYYTGTEEGRSVLWEYRFSQSGEANQADDLSMHVPRYCPGSIRTISGSTQSNRLFLNSSLDPGTLYVYSTFRQDGQRKQMAWSKISFNGVGSIWHHWVDKGNLYVIAQHTAGGYVQVFWLPLNSNLGETRNDDLRIDYKRPVALSWNATLQRYEFALPVGFEQLPDLRVLYPNDVNGWWTSYTPALAWTGNQWIGYFTTGTGPSLNVNVSAVVGSRLIRTMRFSPFYPSAGDAGNTPMGRLQLHRLHIDALKAGDFTATVSRKDRGDASYQLSPMVVGSGLGPHTDGNQTYGFPINCEGPKATVTITTDSTYPFVVTGYTLSGRYINTRN